MSCDKDLSGTDLKVVEYSIVSVSPNLQNDSERLLYGPAVITTTEDMTEGDFNGWVIALYLQAKTDGAERDVYIRRPKVAHNEKQYLRVCYCVQCRMALPDVNYEKKQADALDRINRTLEGMALEKRRPEGPEGEGSNLPDKAR